MYVCTKSVSARRISGKCGGGAITIRNTLAPFSRATSPSLIVCLYLSYCRLITSSPAIAEKLRDASCLTVASVQYPERTLLLLVTSAAYNQILFCCLQRNVENSCHKHSSSVSRHQQTLPLTISITNDECHQLATVRRHHVDNT